MTRALLFAVAIPWAAVSGCLLTSEFSGLSDGGAAPSGSSSTGGAGGSGGSTSSTSASGGSGGTGGGYPDPAICCLGQTCGDDGQCKPIELHKSTVPTSITVDATDIYWADEDDGTIRRLSKSAVPPLSPDILESSAPTVEHLVVNDGYLYWTTHESVPDTYEVRRLSLSGGDAETVTGGAGRATEIAVDAGFVYFTALTDPVHYTSGVFKAPVTGAVAATPLVQDVPYGLKGIALDDGPGGRLYWTAPASNGRIWSLSRTPAAFEEPEVEVDNQPMPYALTVRSGQLYWGNWGDQEPLADSILTRPAGGSPGALSSGQSSPTSIAVGGGAVVWTTFGTGGEDGTVMRLPFGAGAPMTLAASQSNPVSVAVDDLAVYWVVQNSGAVMKKGVCPCEPQ